MDDQLDDFAHFTVEEAAVLIAAGPKLAGDQEQLSVLGQQIALTEERIRKEVRVNFVPGLSLRDRVVHPPDVSDSEWLAELAVTPVTCPACEMQWSKLTLEPHQCASRQDLAEWVRRKKVPSHYDFERASSPPVMVIPSDTAREQIFTALINAQDGFVPMADAALWLVQYATPQYGSDEGLRASLRGSSLLFAALDECDGTSTRDAAGNREPSKNYRLTGSTQKVSIDAMRVAALKMQRVSLVEVIDDAVARRRDVLWPTSSTEAAPSDGSGEEATATSVELEAPEASRVNATRLIEVLGERFGLAEKHFQEVGNLKWLKNARKRNGHGHRPALFDPLDVMQGMLMGAKTEGRREGMQPVLGCERMTETVTWMLLQTQFPHSYAHYSSGDPRVGADLNLTHRADPILTRGWMPTV